MATGIGAYSKTAADNANASSAIDYSEGQSPGAVNNAGREVMKDIADWRDDTGGALTLGGGTTVYTLATNGSVNTLADGTRVHAVVNATNTGASTLNVDSLGAKAIRKVGYPGDEALIGCELLKNGHYIFQYDASANSAEGAWIVLNPSAPPSGGGSFRGLVATNNGSDATNDIDISAGACADHTGVFRIVLPSALTKQLDANWAAGNNAGMRYSGASIANTTYHLYVVAKADGTSDIYAHTSADEATALAALQAETGGSAYVYIRWIWAIVRASNAIRAYTPIGNDCLLTTPKIDHSNVSVTDTASLYGLSVPTGIKVEAKLSVFGARNSTTFILISISDPDVADTAVGSTWISLGFSHSTSGDLQIGGQERHWTDTSGQVRARTFVGSTVLTTITTYGWRFSSDRRS